MRKQCTLLKEKVVVPFVKRKQLFFDREEREMGDNKLEFKTVNEILSSEKQYYIPSYQRGYRWTEQQVKELLNDIDSFDNKNDAWYCLQPIVVRIADDENIGPGKWYEVIDGQQRLTTLFLIIRCCNIRYRNGDEAEKLPEPKFYYKTREDFSSFLQTLSIKTDPNDSTKKISNTMK